jgi:hypothetical protein
MIYASTPPLVKWARVVEFGGWTIRHKIFPGFEI